MNEMIEKVLKAKFEDSSLTRKMKKEVEAFLSSKALITEAEL